MIEAALSALDRSPLAAAIEASRYTYPLLNAAHILGISTLFGSIVALQLRLLGLFEGVPIQPLAKVLPRVASAGLLLAVTTGGLLFTVEPLDYAANTAFLAKMAIVLLAAGHAIYVHAMPAWQDLVRDGSEVVSPQLRVSALSSIVLWIGAILAGRLIAF